MVPSMANAPVSGSGSGAPIGPSGGLTAGAQATSGPVSAPVSSSAVCPGCGKGVDPLRAGHVAILEGRFRYFCRPECSRPRKRWRRPGRPRSPC
jgi:hypothetical protein